jgi:hypothetical protein
MATKKIKARKDSDAAADVIRAEISPLSADNRLQLLLFIAAETIRNNYDEGEHERLAIIAKHELLSWLLPIDRQVPAATTHSNTGELTNAE